MDSWTANRIKGTELKLWRRISVPEEWLKGGSGMCPQDGIILQRYTGDSIPRNLVAKRCVRCGKWWFPSDTFFDYKPAAEAKVNYFRQWGVAADMGNLILPIVSVAVLLTGVSVGVGLVRVRQRAEINAAIGLNDYTGVYLGEGRAMITFTSNNALEIVEYRLKDNEEWQTASLSVEGKYFKAVLEGLEEGQEYVVRIWDKEHILKTVN